MGTQHSAQKRHIDDYDDAPQQALAIAQVFGSDQYLACCTLRPGRNLLEDECSNSCSLCVEGRQCMTCCISRPRRNWLDDIIGEDSALHPRRTWWEDRVIEGVAPASYFDRERGELVQIAQRSRGSGVAIQSGDLPYGKMTWADGASYEGDWCENQATGKGVFTHPNKDQYIGEWWKNMAHGRGVFYHQSLKTYTGEWMYDAQDGNGVEVWNEGSCYEGRFKSGRRHGCGCYYLVDGCVYEGEWVHDVITGCGVYTSADGACYKGRWLESAQHGFGSYSRTDGRKYTGKHSEGKKHGFGIFTWPDGNSFLGYWAYGKRGRDGLYTENSGMSLEGSDSLMQITTVYWNICGLGQPVRYALELAGADYVDVRVEPGPGEPGTPGYKKMYFDHKAAVSESVIFANLPYLLDGDVGLAQSNTILRHIGRKYGLMGNPAAAHIVDLIFDQVSDFDGESTGRCYRDFASMKPYCEVELKHKLRDWARLLGDNTFLTGDKVTVADLKVYETLRKLRLIEAQPSIGTKTIAEFPRILAFLDRIEALPAMAKYLQSEQFMARPLNNVHAQFK